jgi:hypothetical protein
MAVTVWEYYVLEAPATQSLQTQLTALGVLGWELVTSLDPTGCDYGRLIFKRPVA